MNRWIWLLGLLSGCLFTSQNNRCDPASPTYDAPWCHAFCRSVECPSGEGAGFSDEDGCRCVSCAELTCGPDDYRVGCACEPRHGRLECAGGDCNLTCEADFESCDGDDENGCEANLLQDAKHCGGCGRSCGGAECFGGTCSTLRLATISLPGTPSLTADEGYVYFLENDDLERIPIGGGEKETLAGGVLAPIAIDQGYVYWASSAARKIFRVAKSGGSTETLVNGDRVMSSGFAFDGDALLYSTYDSSRSSAAVRRVSPGGEPTTVHEEFAIFGFGSLTATSGAVYWLQAQSVYRATLPAGPEAYVGAIHTETTGFGVLWVDQGVSYVLLNSGLYRLPPEGDQDRLTMGNFAPRQITGDDRHVYFLTNAVFRVGKAGGEPEALSSNDAIAMAVGPDFVFWLTQTGEIIQLRK